MTPSLFKIESENEALYLVKFNEILVCGCIIQYHSDVLYIEALDSTGLIKPRNLQKKIIYSLLANICKSDFSIIALFSRPCKEIIFGKSSLNNEKGYLEPKKLQEFWKFYFTNLNLGKVHIYSNFNSENSFPYKTFDQIRIFDDDPKRKCEIEDEINVFYESLLHRADFLKGSLIYLKKVEPRKENLKVKFDYDSIVRRSCSFLRNQDFSNLENGILSTKRFFEKFYCENLGFEILEPPIKKEALENVIFIKTNVKY